MKEKKRFKIAELISKLILYGELSPGESAFLDKWRRGSAANSELLSRLGDSESRESIIKELDRFDVDQGWREIEYKLIEYRTPRFYTKGWFRYAATFLLLATLSLSIFTISKQLGGDAFEVAPLNEGAYITMSDGSTIDLEKVVGDSVVERRGVKIDMDRDSAIIRYSLSRDAGERLKKGSPSRVSTGGGKEYKVVLPDGSVVHLNSKSEIVFDAVFAGDERDVQMKGEAFFDVVRDEKHPFVVTCGEMTATVLGTSFNIKGYENESNVSATLISGSLKISGAGASMIISPNQQAQITEGERGIRVKTVDGDILTSWTKGYFAFKDEKLSDILKALQRWYDFEYQFNDIKTGEIRMGLSLNRGVSFAEIVETFKNSSLVTVEYSDGRLLFKGLIYKP